MVYIFYTAYYIYICVDLANDEIFCAKVGKGGITISILDGPRREKNCLRGLRPSWIPTSLLSYRY